MLYQYFGRSLSFKSNRVCSVMASLLVGYLTIDDRPLTIKDCLRSKVYSPTKQKHPSPYGTDVDSVVPPNSGRTRCVRASLTEYNHHRFIPCPVTGAARRCYSGP